MYEEVIWRSNWQPCQFNQSSDISSSSDSVASSSCCIFSSGTSSASSFSASSCFSSSCYFQIHVCWSLNGSQIFTEHVSKSLCRTRDLGSIQQVASNATIRKKAMVDTCKKQTSRGWHCCTTCIYLNRNRVITLLQLHSHHRKDQKSIGKPCFAIAVYTTHVLDGSMLWGSVL